MRGIELSKNYYEQFGKPMLEREFPEYIERMAIGLVGHGSECFGFDDEISLDHDFEPGFCIWLTEADEAEFGFKLFRAYSKLPKEFEGIRLKQKSALGNGTKGVQIISDFYRRYTGSCGVPESWRQWLYTPSEYFAEATNGEVFYDGLGEFTKIRNEILYGMPEDVRLKKIAARAVEMAQSGQYNYSRCLKHKESAAAQTALFEFSKSTVEMIFLLNKRHKPYYKWMYRAMKELPVLADMAEPLEFLLCTENSEKLKSEIVEDICRLVAAEMKNQGLTDSSDSYLESHAFSVTERIKNSEIRNLHIMEG